MDSNNNNQWSIQKYSLDSYLPTAIDAFLIDRKAQNLSNGTIHFYRFKFKLLLLFCESQQVTQVEQITPNFIRQYLFWLRETGHSEGGVHAGFRTLRAFLRWWGDEVEPENWKNPINKVKAPKLDIQPLEPVALDIVKKLIDSCPNTFEGLRDKAIFYALLDTGARANELLAMNSKDLNMVTGEILIRKGKGGKPRSVFVSKKSKKAIRQYLKVRKDDNSALWVKANGEALSYWGLVDLLDLRSKAAKINRPSLHDFRRAFALNMLRNGVDIYSIQLLMGHADLQVLRRYLKQNTDDLAQAHRRGSPVDKM